MIKIIIVDDHQMFIDGIKSLLLSQENIAVVGSAHNGDEVLKLLTNKKADIVLMDINMPQMDGVEATKRIQQQFPKTKVLMLTMYDTKNYIERLVLAGASGYILKNTGKTELMNAIETIYSGKTFFGKEVTARVMEGLQKKTRESNDFFGIELTEREIEVIKYIAQEYTSTEIAKKLTISPYTVETHRKNLINKLGVRNTAGLVKYAMQNGLAD
jgi:two-component system, NarL family, nitrate/nitrite response regulator NarL